MASTKKNSQTSRSNRATTTQVTSNHNRIHVAMPAMTAMSALVETVRLLSSHLIIAKRLKEIHFRVVA